MKHLLFVFPLLLCLQLAGQPQNESTLSLSEIMKGEEYVGYLPTNIRWSDDNRFIYFSWNPDGDTLRSIYKVETTSKNIEKLSFEDLKINDFRR